MSFGRIAFGPRRLRTAHDPRDQLQIPGWAGEGQRKALPRLGLTHNLGGFPHHNVCSTFLVRR